MHFENRIKFTPNKKEQLKVCGNSDGVVEVGSGKTTSKHLPAWLRLLLTTINKQKS